MGFGYFSQGQNNESVQIGRENTQDMTSVVTKALFKNMEMRTISIRISIQTQTHLEMPL